MWLPGLKLAGQATPFNFLQGFQVILQMVHFLGYVVGQVLVVNHVGRRAVDE
jgi:hypothetical protein